MSELLRIGAAIVQRDARLFASYRLQPLKELVGAIFGVVLFHQLAQLVSTARFPTRSAYFEFAVVGLAMMPLLRSSLAGPVGALREELIAGTFERLALSPRGAAPCLLATLVFPFALSMLSAILILLIAGAFFGLHMSWSTAPLALPIGALAALAMAPFSAVMLAAGVAVKQVGAGAGWIVAGLSLVGGVYFPVALLPPWISWAADVQPLTPALSLLRHVLTGSRLESSLATELGSLVAFSVVGLAIGSFVLRAACNHARRRGALLEY